MSKPRLTETHDLFWAKVEESINYWKEFGYSIIIDTLGEGAYSFDKDKRIIQVYGIDNNVSTYEYVRNYGHLDAAIEADTIEVWARPYSSHLEWKLLHSPSGKSWK